MNSFERDMNRRVLIVDDNKAIHDDIRKILSDGVEENGKTDRGAAELFGDPQKPTAGVHFEIESAMQGQEGLECVRKSVQEGRPYAMAFIDVQMPPGWDGIETTTKIWEVYPDLQV